MPVDDGEDETVFPYVIVRLLEGGKEDEAARKMEMELFKIRILEGKYELVFPFRWVLQDEDTWPFFYGAMETNWNIAFIEREDETLWRDRA